MSKQKEQNYDIPQKKIEEKEEFIPKQETPKGRQEDYFFPEQRITIKAGSLEEAKEKLKKLK